MVVELGNCFGECPVEKEEFVGLLTINILAFSS
jgi:hypothetical protein